MLEGKCEENGVPKDVELTQLENRNELEQNKNAKKKENQEKKMKRMRDEWKDNEKWSFMKWSLVWSPWNTVWAYLSFFSEPRTQAYITYLKVHFDWT